MNNKKRILLVSNLPTSYFVEYANELGKYHNVTLIFEKNTNIHTKKENYINPNYNFKLIVLNGLKVSSEDYFSLKIRKYLKKRDFDYVVFSNPCTTTGIIGEIYCRWHKIPYIIQSEGGTPGDGHGWKEHLKKYVMEKAILFLSGTSINDSNYFLKYGASLDKLKKYNFSSQHKEDIDNKIYSKQEKMNIRHRLNIQEEKVILCVGQFIHRKGIDTLLEACEGLDESTGVYIIGGTPTDEYYKIINKLRLKNIHFEKRIPFDDVADYYRSADLFVLLSREDTWGLVINEAMSHALPIITTNKVVSAIELIEDGVNGYIINPDDPKKTKMLIKTLLNDKNLTTKMGKNNLNKIREYSIEDMALTISNYLSDLK